METDIDDLAEHVQALPQELYDKIYNEVFTADVQTTELTIDLSLKPPKLLAVDRASRLLFAQSYYSHCFNFTVVSNSARILVKWLESLPENHLLILKKIIFFDQYTTLERRHFLDFKYDGQRFGQDILRTHAAVWQSLLEKELYALGEGVVKMELRVSCPETGEFLRFVNEVCSSIPTACFAFADQNSPCSCRSLEAVHNNDPAMMQVDKKGHRVIDVSTMHDLVNGVTETS